MGRIFDFVKWGATLGKEPQNFLGAKWIPAFLNRVPDAKKRMWALRILSLSPHYFIDADNPQFAGMKTDEYLDKSFDLILQSRVEIYEKVFKKHFQKDFTVLDYGCGPGFLAKAAAPYVGKIYGIDISSGAIACAKILNGAGNIEYFTADDKGLAQVPDNSCDAVYSFAVVQHLTDEIFEMVLENCRRKLKPGGRLLLHIQLKDRVWHTQDEWETDKSMKGKIKYRYGLHCFGRTEEEYSELVARHGFGEINIEKLADLFQTDSEELDSQRILAARKKDS